MIPSSSSSSLSSVCLCHSQQHKLSSLVHSPLRLLPSSVLPCRAVSFLRCGISRCTTPHRGQRAVLVSRRPPIVAETISARLSDARCVERSVWLLVVAENSSDAKAKTTTTRRKRHTQTKTNLDIHWHHDEKDDCFHRCCTMLVSAARAAAAIDTRHGSSVVSFL